MVSLSPDAQATIESYERIFGQDVVESCLQRWIEGDGAFDPDAMVSKPDIGGFHTFLSECLGAPLRSEAR